MSPLTLYIVSLIFLGCLSACGIWCLKLQKDAQKFIKHSSELERLKNEIETAQNTTNSLIQEMAVLKTEKANAQDIISQQERAQQQLNDLNNLLPGLESKVSKTKSDLNDITDQYNQKKEVLTELNGEIQKLSGTKNQLDDNIRKQEEQKQSLDSKIAQLQKQEALINDEISSLKTVKSGLLQEHSDLNSKVENLKDLVTELRESLLDVEKQKTIIEAYIKTSESKKADLNKELDVINEKIASRKSRKEALEASLINLEKEKEELIDAINKIKRDNSPVIKELEQAGAELARIQEQIAKAKEELSGMDKAMQDLLSTKEELNRAKKELADYKEKMQKEKEAWDLEIQEKKKEYDQIISNINTAETTIAGLNGKLEGLEISEERKWEDLERPMPNIIIPSDPKRWEEQEWLSKFKSELKSSGIIFDERMIHSFHTGLKTQDFSPLVVLAGISGTGKSLLPELYAHACGMNFLQVAVQPRWDSPQDMLGFYNYMESRFKATELSRLLWQSDAFNNPADNTEDEGKKKDLFTHQNTMNLVLLDEMNLARVEYYFSDMLSKLEVRRGIDPTHPGQRHPAEIEIEGGSSKKDSSKRLFISSNTLFVGTMNEDESTQSLSDKVVDRSNVIRFGKPASLNAKPDKTRFRKQFDSSYMDPKNWTRSWIQNDQTSKDESNLLNTLEAINKELATVNRSFAHRVTQSVKAYIRNYPSGYNSFKNALSDQLEMKILPKLSGLEVDDASVRHVLNNIKSTIDKETGDKELVEAFEQSEKSSTGFFQWRGVHRNEKG